MQDELSHVMSTRGKANQELAETQVLPLLHLRCLESLKGSVSDEATEE